MTPARSAELARSIASTRVTAGAEREITVDRSNECVVVDESVFVKWMTPPVPSPHHGLSMLQHLREIGFTAMPEYLGASVSDGFVRAIVFEHVAGAVDGWEWFFDEVLAWADGSAAERSVLDSACRIGALGGDLHLAISTPSSVFPDPVTTVDVSVERARCTDLLDRSLTEVRAPDDAVRTLTSCRAAIEHALAAMPDGPTSAITVHGDLHVGQILRSGERIVVTDFDGNPLLDGGAPIAPRPSAVDLASLAQSVDHAVRMAQHRRPGRGDEFDRLASDAAATTIDAYTRRLAFAGRRSLLDERLLPGLRAAQELHELVYAVRRLPRWIYAPTLALQGMFGRGDS